MFLIPSPAMSFLCYSALENTKDHFWILLRLTRFALMCTPPAPLVFWFDVFSFIRGSSCHPNSVSDGHPISNRSDNF